MILYICFSFVILKEQYEDTSVYNFLIDNNRFLVYENNILKIIKSDGRFPSTGRFRIIKNINNDYYYIENVISKLKLSVNKNNLELVSEGDKMEWIFIKLEDKYIIKNIKEQCYITKKWFSIICENKEKEAIKFELKKIFELVKHTKEDLQLIENTPVDILIKYIDLSDPYLVREGIPQIKKDEDNEELKYNVRGILKNIPWVRKIFIVMPNKKVRYFKDYELIKEKIIYVKDKDLLGFDSSSSNLFQFTFWKMKNFNISSNFLLLDDDSFVGKPLNKSEFFHVENGKVVPSIISPEFKEYTLKSTQKKYQYYKERIEGKQTEADFWYSVYKGYLFLLKKYNDTLILPEFTHNIIPCNIDDIKELYNIVYNSEYNQSTLFSIYRHVEALQFQSLYMAYFFIKYYRKVYPIKTNVLDAANTMGENYDYPLFCINTGSDDYSTFSFMKAKIAMEYNFPEPTPYEIYNYTNLPNLAYNIISENEKKQNQLKIKIIFSSIIIIILILIEVITIVFFVYYIKVKLKQGYKKLTNDNKLIYEEKDKLLI